MDLRLKKNRRGTFRWAAGLVVVAMLWSSGRTLPGDDADRATTAASAVTTDRDETSSVDEALDSQHPASEHEDTGRSADSDGSGELDSAGHDVNGHDTGGHEGGEHVNPVAPVLAGIVIILLLAKIGGDLFERVGMPAVLGELLVGVLLGNAALLTGWMEGQPLLDAVHSFAVDLEFLKAPPESVQGNPYSAGAVLKILAEIGVILLLFEVGLESSVKDMLSVGASSLLVAILGVIAPMLLGMLVGWVLLPHKPGSVHAFLGAALCATSVGITARVLKDLGRSQQREARIILGAAVIDDVLGLIVLAVVQGAILAGTVDFGSILHILGTSIAFLAGAILLGTRIFTRPLFKFASYLRGHGLLVATSLVICFGFAWFANWMGLATIVGAFSAGLILEHAHYRELGKRENVQLEEALAPLTALLVPIFFVEMGIDVDLRSFQDPSVWGLAAALTAAAIIGKQVCSLGVVEPGRNRLAIGLGMIPRGEVGLIFAKIGKDLVTSDGPVISPQTYSAIVVMVMITTMVTPPLLKWSLARRPSDLPASSPPPSS